MMEGGNALSVVISELSTDLKIHLECILYNPEDLTGYDWTTNLYPLAFELIEPLKDLVLRKEFQIIVNAKVDEVANMKNDSIRYHDQGNIN